MMAGRHHAGREATLPGFDEYRRQRTILLTTRKRDGTTVGTPVNIALDPDGRAYFRTWSATGKVKRMRNFPQVQIAPSTVAAPANPSAPATGAARTSDNHPDHRHTDPAPLNYDRRVRQ